MWTPLITQQVANKLERGLFSFLVIRQQISLILKLKLCGVNYVDTIKLSSTSQFGLILNFEYFALHLTRDILFSSSTFLEKWVNRVLAEYVKLKGWKETKCDWVEIHRITKK